MTTRTPGLSPAMRRGLLDPREVNAATLRLLFQRQLIDEPDRYAAPTPRGHAALAAPRMTRAEYEALQWYAGETSGLSFPHGKTISRLVGRKWLSEGWLDRELTQVGLTALNNMRAAEGSPDYKEST